MAAFDGADEAGTKNFAEGKKFMKSSGGILCAEFTKTMRN